MDIDNGNMLTMNSLTHGTDERNWGQAAPFRAAIDLFFERQAAYFAQRNQDVDKRQDQMLDALERKREQARVRMQRLRARRRPFCDEVANGGPTQ